MKRMVRFFASLIMITYCNSVFAVSVNIQEPDFYPSAGQNTRSLSVVNDGDEPYAGELTYVLRTHDINGKEIHTQSNNFSIFPERFVVPPGEEVAVTLTWKGGEPVPQEQAYRIILKEKKAKVYTEDTKAAQKAKRSRFGFAVFTEYHKSVFVHPQHEKPALEMSAVEPVVSAGINKLKLTLVNFGNAKQVMKDATLTVYRVNEKGEKVKGMSSDLAPSELKGAILVLPKETRVFYLPWPKELTVGPLKGTFTFEKTEDL